MKQWVGVWWKIEMVFFLSVKGFLSYEFRAAREILMYGISLFSYDECALQPFHDGEILSFEIRWIRFSGGEVVYV
ncbi:MAG: hypothetical protein ACK4HQ_02635 [Brevinematales bacterium]